ncbi:uncharacterized protein LOC112183675 [Rosa chinensis]|uniref:uncharacterized protein LOC112183675 n=1 Tax=Rosa chinensis TaxID=74649 RepID=UPI000D08C892|nr:uncharacterized protein LOC112183675 [Rosa chinensis]
MSISLHDLNVIGGLPVSGEPYEEFIPPNKDLVKVELYHSTVAELLRIYTYLCAAYKSRYVYWPWWIEHFYRGEIIYGAYGECKNSGVPKLREPKLELKISKQGRLAAFLAFWLSRFVLPSNSKKIRPETFYMASLMAQGIRVSLAPTVLGYVYHGLGEMATHSAGPGSSNSCLPIHYVIGWLGEYFPYLYSSRSDKEFPGGYPRLARYAGIQGRSLSITEARMVFRTNKSVVHRPISVACEKDRFLLDDDKLPDVLFEVLVCMRSAVLPVRVGESLFLEPYYPNRFARQFGLDQSVPSNKLTFSVSKRQQCGVEDLLRAQTILYRKNTTSRFFIPRSSRSGQCTWWYCRWWSRACTPYLGLSVSKTFTTLNKRPPEKSQSVFVVQNLREISTGLKQEIKISKVDKSLGKSSRKAPRKSRDGASCSKASRAHPTDERGGHKRVRLEKVVEETVVIPVKSSSNGEHELDVHSPLRAEAPNQVIENEAVMPTICLSEASSNQALSPLSNLENSISNLLGSELPSFKKNYLIAQVVDIYAKVSSSSTPKELLVHVLDIRSSLDMLHPAIKPLKAGKSQLEAFVTAIEKMLEVADQSLATTEVLEQKTTMDVELEKCKKSKGSLESQLAGSSKELEALKATESDIIADEQRVQKRRSEYNAKRQSLEDTLQELKDSLKEHDERGQKLQEDRAAYMEEKLPEIEQASASYKLETEAYQSLFDSFFPLFHVCTTPVQT